MKITNHASLTLTLTLICIFVTACSVTLVETNVPASDSPEAVTRIQNAVSACANPIDEPDAQSLASGDPDLFSWLVFLSINCPAQSSQASPLIWETWKPNYAVYLPNGQTPNPWGSPLPPRILSADPEISGYKLVDIHGKPGLYEIRMNEPAFNYIVTRELYGKAGQLKFFNAPASDPMGAPIVFPSNAIEIKAAWLILDPNTDPLDRYYTIQSQYMDENGQLQSVLAGLSGFHITSKALPNWVWSTFEQVDNQSMTPAPQTLPTTPTAQKMNELVHVSLPQDSPWQYYILRGSQIAFTDANNNPTLLANTLIETDFQKSSSCITCHALSSRGAASQGRLPFFNTTTSDIQGYIGNINDPGNMYYDAFGDPVCFNASLSAFTNCNNPDQIVYKLMDFLWSLREAQ